MDGSIRAKHHNLDTELRRASPLRFVHLRCQSHFPPEATMKQVILLLLTTLVPASMAGQCFNTTEELIAAVDAYLDDPSPDTVVANTYGHPIGDWCVTDIEDFGYLFDSRRNPKAATFNEDLNWCTCSATNMRFMFAGANAFNGDISSFVTYSVTNMEGMFEAAGSFNGDISMWDVSKVKKFSTMFNRAFSFEGDLSR